MDFVARDMPKDSEISVYDSTIVITITISTKYY